MWKAGHAIGNRNGIHDSGNGREEPAVGGNSSIRSWTQEHLALLAPRAALLCEGTAFKKIALLSPDKLKTSDLSGIQLLVTTLGGAWGQTALEKSYDSFEKAIYGTVQKPDETHDSYLARHDVHFEELKAQGTTLDQIRAYVLLRQSQLSAEDRKRIVVEQGGKLEYSKAAPAIRLLGSRVFSDLQGQRGAMRNKVYDANVLEENPAEEPDRQPAASAFVAPSEEPEVDLDPEFMETMMAAEDADALQVQGFEEELESFFQETPELQEALVSYLEARSRLLAKRRNQWRKSQGPFWQRKRSRQRGSRTATPKDCPIDVQSLWRERTLEGGVSKVWQTRIHEQWSEQDRSSDLRG